MKLPATVAAVWTKSLNNVIGRDGRIPSEFASTDDYVQSLVRKNTVVMGRKTFEELPAWVTETSPTVVLSRNKDYEVRDNVILLDELNNLEVNTPAVFFLGGKEIFEFILPFVNRLYITTQNTFVEGDVQGPSVFTMLKRLEWDIASTETITGPKGFFLTHTAYVKD